MMRCADSTTPMPPPRAMKARKKKPPKTIYRNQALDLAGRARNVSCAFLILPERQRDHRSLVTSNRLRDGKGKGIKAHDCIARVTVFRSITAAAALKLSYLSLRLTPRIIDLGKYRERSAVALYGVIE